MLKRQGHPSDYYMIDANPNDYIKPVKVFCDMLSTPASTLLRHNHEKEQAIEKCATGLLPHCATLGFVYGVSRVQIDELIQQANRPYMQIIYEGINSPINTSAVYFGNGIQRLADKCQCGNNMKACSDVCK